MTRPTHLDPDEWLRAVFSAKSVGRGGVIHRATRDVERFAGRKAFLAEVRKRGFTLVENGSQFVVFCNREPVRLVVERDPPRLSDRALPTFRRSAVANQNASTRL
ncbi:aspartate aminotransferase [Marivita sp. S6314]|uniref:aspartate aminotransferase n=1 Tax=Marivita sp. S6314 TaxID=2926406 RepID=UPI0032B2CA96